MRTKMDRIIRRTLSVILMVSVLCSVVGADKAQAISNEFISSEDTSTITIGNSFVTLSVNKNTAGYTLKTIEGDVLTKTDNNKRLLYTPEGDDTSFSTVHIDDEDYVYGNVDEDAGNRFITKPHVEGESVISTYHIEEKNVNVTQKIKLLMDSKDEKLGSIQISYTIENAGNGDTEQSVQAGLRMILDTCLGSQDYAVYEMASNTNNGTYKQYTKAVQFKKNEIATEFRALDNNYAPRVAAYGYMDASTGTPDSMVFGHWYDMASCGWKYEVDENLSLVDNNDKNYSTADSAVALYWNPDEIKPGEKKNYSFYYGISANNNITENSTMQISVKADKDSFELEKDANGNVVGTQNSKYKDNTLKLQVKVANTLPASEFRDNVVVHLVLDEDYLQVDSNDVTADSENLACDENEGKNIIHITNFETGQTKVINWTIHVKKLPESIRYLQYAVKVYPSAASEQERDFAYLDRVAFCSAKGKVLAPGYTGKKPAISILKGMPGQLFYNGNRNFVIRGEGFDILTNKSEWDLQLKNLTTGESQTVDSSMISFNSDKTAMVVRFTDEKPVGRYQLIIKPGTSLTTEEIGLPETITSPNMIFYMSDDPDLVNPPVGAVAIKKEVSGNSYVYKIETMDPDELENLDDNYLMTVTGNLYQTQGDTYQSFIPITGDGTDTEIIINRILNFSGEEFSIDYTYDKNNKKNGVRISMNGDTGIIGASRNMWEYESVIELKDGKNYSLDPDETEEGEATPIKITQKGITGALQKISGFIFNLNNGTFNKREIDGESYNTISLGGRMGLGFLSADDYDGIVGLGAELNVDDVRYGEKQNGGSGLIGIKASGGVQVPQFTEAMPEKISGELEVDTIDHMYLVNVGGEMELATFEAEFELEIISSKHGVPVPNILDLKVGGIEPGVPIVFPPVIFLNGGRGSINGLYSLFYPGETDGWPDTSIKIGGQFSIVDIFKGWLNLELGTRSAAISGEEIEVAEMDIFRSIEGRFNWYDPISFEFSADLEIFKIIRGGVDCKFIIVGEDGTDLDISGRVAVVFPNVLLGKDLTVAGIALGGNKRRIYGSTTLLGVDLSFVYYFGGNKNSLKLDALDVPVAENNKNNDTMGIANAQCVATTEEEAEEKAKVAEEKAVSGTNKNIFSSSPYMSVVTGRFIGGSSESEAKELELKIDEDGKLIIKNVDKTRDELLKVYYDMKDGEQSELKVSDVKVALDKTAKEMVGIESDEDGVATNMDKANVAMGEDEKGKFIVLSFTKEELASEPEIAVYSDVATFSYAQLYKMGNVPKLDSVSASVDSGKLNVNLATNDAGNFTGKRIVYFSKTKEGSHDYKVAEIEDEDSMDAIEVPSEIPTGSYYVTVVMDGKSDGADCHCEEVSSEMVDYVNPKAPASKLTKISATSCGNAEANISVEGFDKNTMGGVFVEAYELDENGAKTGAPIEKFISADEMTDGAFQVKLSPKEEMGSNYIIAAYPANKLREEEFALGSETDSETVLIPYPEPATIEIGYTADSKEEVVEIPSQQEGGEPTKYTNQLFTEVPEQGIGIHITSDKEVQAKVYIDDVQVNDITTWSTEFPIIKLEDAEHNILRDGEHKIKVVAKTKSGDTSIQESSLRIDTAGPVLQVFTPQAGDSVSGSISFSGLVDAGSKLSLNIDDTDVDIASEDYENGSFKFKADIPSAEKNLISHKVKLTAEDEYGRKTEYNAELNTSKSLSVKRVYLKADGKEVDEGERIDASGKKEIALNLFAETEEGKEIELTSDMIDFESMSEEDDDNISIDENGLVKISGEGTMAVAAKYRLTDDFCYQSSVVIDSYKEKLRTKDAKEPVITDKNPAVTTISKGNSVTFSVEAVSEDNGTLTYEWFEKAGDGEFVKVGEGKDFEITPTCEVNQYEYYAAVTNTVRTTGISQATSYTEKKIVNVRGEASIEDFVIEGEKTTVSGVEYYMGNLSIRAKSEGGKVKLADGAEWQDEITLDNLVDGEHTVSILLFAADGREFEPVEYKFLIKNEVVTPQFDVSVDGESVNNQENAVVDNADVSVDIDSKGQTIDKISYTVTNGDKTTSGESENAKFNISVTDQGINSITITATVGKKDFVKRLSVIIYKKPEFEIEMPDEYTYNGLPVSGYDIKKNTTGAVTVYSKSESDSEYTEELPVNAGKYDVKFVLEQDDTNYYLGGTVEKKVTINKARQSLKFANDVYEKNIGEKIIISVGGVMVGDADKIHVTSSDNDIAEIDEDGMTYNEESRTVSIPVTVKTKGSAEITVEVDGNNNYKEASNFCSVQGIIGVSEEHPYTLDGKRGKNSWFVSAVTIEPTEGYTVSETADGEFGASYVITKQGEGVQPEKLYFKDSEGMVKEISIEEISIDVKAPTAAIKADKSVWREFLNMITFGLFFKEKVVVEVTEKTDDVSGVAQVLYYKSSSALDRTEIEALNNNDWSDSYVTIEPDSKAVVYAKIVDYAGNETIISTDGIIADSTPSLLTVTSDQNLENWVTEKKASIHVEASDKLSGLKQVSYVVDNGSAIEGSNSFDITDIEDGIHLIAIEAEDNAGNKSIETVQIKQDTTIPTVTLHESSDKSKIEITCNVGASGIKKVTLIRDGQESDITTSYKDGVAITDNAKYSVRVETVAGVIANQTIQITDYTSGKNTETKEEPKATDNKQTDNKDTTGKTTGDTKTESTVKTPKLETAEKTLKAGKTYKIKVNNANNETIRYVVSNKDKKVINVSGGIVRALKKGTATVNVVVGSNVLQLKVTVENNPKLSKKKLTVKKGKTKSIKVSGKVKDIKLKTSKIKIAKVSVTKAGKVKIKGLKKGKKTLKIKVNGVKTLKLKVIVK